MGHGPLMSGTSWALVARKTARHIRRPAAGPAYQIDGLSLLITPFLLLEPRSAVAENWPLVRP